MSDLPRLENQTTEIPLVFPDGCVVFLGVGTASYSSSFVPDDDKVHPFQLQQARSPERDVRARALQEVRQEKKSGLRQALLGGGSLLALAAGCGWGAGEATMGIVHMAMTEVAQAAAHGQAVPWTDLVPYAFPVAAAWGFAGMICALPAIACWGGLKKRAGKDSVLKTLTAAVRETEAALAAQDPNGVCASALPDDKPSLACRWLRNLKPGGLAR